MLLQGDWDAADRELTQAMGAGGLGDEDYMTVQRGWLAALRGDAATAEAMLAGLGDLQASEDPQDKAVISVVEAFTAAARRQPENALLHARATLGYADALGISFECLRWAWPLAARVVYELRRQPPAPSNCSRCSIPSSPGTWLPCCGAERDLVRARLAAHDSDQAAAGAFASAISMPA